MSADKGVRADYMDRAFRKMEDAVRDMPRRTRHPNQTNGYKPIRSKNPNQGLTPKDIAKRNLTRDLEALSQAQASRPLKPPGKR